jgi:4'-phosphopantetheinyl transferase
MNATQKRRPRRDLVTAIGRQQMVRIVLQASTMQKQRTAEIAAVNAPGTRDPEPGMTTLLYWPAIAQGDAPLTLPTDRVDCWAVSLTALPADVEGMLHTLLSASELERAERFRFEPLRARYISRHAALRLLISRYLRASPASIRVVHETNGRPILEDPASRLHFNLSHSGDLALVAVSCIAPVGVDVEEVRNIPDFAEIARDQFALTEVEALFRVPLQKRLFAFFVTWTRKEAFVKALGLGLSFPLDTFSTGRPDRPPLLSLGGAPCTDWTMTDLLPSRGHTASVAIRHPNVSIRCQRAEWSWLLERIRNPANR